MHMHPDGNIGKVHIDRFMAGLLTVTTYVEFAGVIEYYLDTDGDRARTVIAAEYATQDPDIVDRQCDGFVVWCRIGRCACSELCELLATARPPLLYTPCGKV